MKYTSTLPLSALFALSLILTLVKTDIIPDGYTMLEALNSQFAEYYFTLIFLIILLESIVYVGFYFPGQFFAVLLVVLSKPGPQEILLLTICMVAAATLGSAVNFFLGSRFAQVEIDVKKAPVKQLLLAMIHMNALAFFMLNQGANRAQPRVVLLAGLINLPYYLLLIFVTATLSDEIMTMAENSWLIFGLVLLWLGIALGIDWKRHILKKQTAR